MGLANNLNKFEWENEIPFSEEQVKKTLHAMVGEGSKVSGLLNKNKQWGLTCVNSESNDTFGSYSFGQINSVFSITIKKVNENNSHLHITISERQGAFITGNQAYLQSECNNFIKALTFYLEDSNSITWWYDIWKPQCKKVTIETTKLSKKKSKGFNILINSFIILIIVTIILWIVIFFLNFI
jgi:hypothetical protein